MRANCITLIDWSTLIDRWLKPLKCPLNAFEARFTVDFIKIESLQDKISYIVFSLILNYLGQIAAVFRWAPPPKPFHLYTNSAYSVQTMLGKFIFHLTS